MTEPGADEAKVTVCERWTTDCATAVEDDAVTGADPAYAAVTFRVPAEARTTMLTRESAQPVSCRAR
ncbi:hypothetical protein GCM10009740_36000 [Terrabacter terrae]|uniref:Uncharacterized protein n=1 Tax=Terrabacter terrae TaxID=318434 RepID=A0ABP5G495_9MICO